MSLFLPFNQRPSSTTVRTGSYTIPSGKYARVTVLEADIDFTINGAITLVRRRYFGTTNIPQVGGQQDAFVNNTQFTLEGTISGDSINTTMLITDNSNYVIQSGLTGSLPASGIAAYQVQLAPGDKVRAQHSGAGSSNVRYTFVAKDTARDLQFWCDSGDVLSGTRYLVEEYDIA